MKRYTRSGVLLCVATVCAAVQAWELFARSGAPFQVALLTLMAGLTGITGADFFYHRALTQHLTRISLKAAARRGVPSGRTTTTQAE